jgi:hypothetical protein
MTQEAVSYKDYQSNDKTGSMKKSVDAGTLVLIDDYIPGTHSLKVRRFDNGKPLKNPRSMNENITHAKAFEQSRSMTLKTLPAPDAPIVEANDEEASIRGSSDNGFYSSRQFGNIVKGPISFSAQPHEIRIGGLMTLHPLLMSGFPSTIVTPIPTMQWSLPTAAMLGPIAKDIALMSSLVMV